MKFNIKFTAVLFCLFAAGTLSSKAQALAQPLNAHATSYKAAVTEFSDHLYKIATDKAKQEQYHLTYDTRVSLKTFINTGISKMFSDGLTEEKFTRMAEDNIMRFIGAMINDAQKRGVVNSLDIITFRTARTICCPGWPFC